MASAGRRHGAGPLVLPHLRPWQREAPNDARLAVLCPLESGRTSWSAFLGAVRLAPGADLAAVTAGQIREVVSTRADNGCLRGQTREPGPPGRAGRALAGAGS